MTQKKRTFVLFHHAAPFAVTRWTNLYFKTEKLGCIGDIIGGPIQGQFGNWVKDIAMPSPRQHFTHTWYWRKSENSEQDNHIKELGNALQLGTRTELKNLLNEIPAFTLLDESSPYRQR
ncbi:hypothetical protein [Stenomitos frigidus]|uniref:Uncharacterized protein n=1 Tax=Stenomitos frigidus ULC18 TaxID=2107698 RepID=A0A2T1DU35_9CYAN|nr:hypothetical protein [Stenomitos frigidus]PSB24008.1 hypothetical protein C7B82_28745 [Stenomitos frigidus ULC18]